MAKSRSSKRGGRDGHTIANVSLPRPLVISSPANLLTEIEDRRSHYPEDFRPALDIAGRPHKLQYPSPKKTRLNRDRFAFLRGFPSPRVQFQNSQNVLVCVRRKQRKEVLHALNKTGRGKGKQRRPRRSRYSSISC